MKVKALFSILLLTFFPKLNLPVNFVYIDSQQYDQPGAGVVLPGEPIPGSSTKQDVDQQATINRYFEIELREDDTVAITDRFINMPNYSSWTYHGPADVEWLNLAGGTRYVINGSNVTFYNVIGELSVSFRSRHHSNRQGDVVTFGAGPWASDPFNVTASVYFPTWYRLTSATPAGYGVNTGNLQWTFSNIKSVTINAYFNQTGGQRPRFDLPVDYQNRAIGLGANFARAFNTRTTSLLDHELPNYTSNGYILLYTGEEIADPIDRDCRLGYNCYDGHDGYDFDDLCPNQSPCTNRSAVYPAANGEITRAGWLDNIAGCQIEINHDNGWTTRYAHLEDDESGNHTCPGILQESGQVTRLTRIGTIGDSGTGADGTHLHFVVRHNGIVVDPSGWDPDPPATPDPWQVQSGETSHPMWMHSIRTTRIAPIQTNTAIPSQYYNVIVNVPPSYHSNELVFTLAELPALHLPGNLINTGHSFSLNAVDSNGNVIHQLNRQLNITVDFGSEELEGIQPRSLSLYTWNMSTETWTPIQTSVDLSRTRAVANVNHLSIFAFMGTKIQKVFLPIVIK